VIIIGFEEDAIYTSHDITTKCEVGGDKTFPEG